MKKLIILSSSTLFILFAVLSSCTSQTTSSAGENAMIDSGNGTVTVYYFHGERRCVTCKAVGKVSKETIESSFADNPNVKFLDINIDEPENNELKDKMEMSGSGLFIYNGKVKEDLTAIAFQKAVDHPEELAEKIISTVNQLL
ncbi:MAG TPA: nitrophenyl compound nitroreductase subunit ArsF family protein [Bacteroidales bacterium]|nr:nitrophenyl compound nitroreductase subunit ArsF family protein [Bacteroidales bacterium]